MSFFLRFGRFVLAFAIVILAVGGTYLGQNLLLKYNMNNPYFITYFNTSWLLFLGIFSFSSFVIRHKLRPNTAQYAPIAHQYVENMEENQNTIIVSRGNIFEDYFHSIQSETTQITFKKMFFSAIAFAVFWLLANYIYGLGLALTNAASSLSLEQVATVLVFILSVVILKEQITVLKVISIAGCIGGAILIAVADKQAEDGKSGSNPLLGDIFVLISTVATALYMVLYKKLLNNLSLSAVNLFLAMIGFWDLVLFWPGILLLHYLGIETLSTDKFSMFNIGMLVINALSALGFNYLLNLGIFWTSPLFMRVAIMCTIPTSFLVNTLLLGTPFNWIRFGGALLIICGFILFAFGDNTRQKETTKK